MRLTYVLLSPTFGMHQYTADLANRMAGAGHEVSLVTTTLLPRDRYAPAVAVEAAAAIGDTGLSPGSLDGRRYRAVIKAILAQRPDAVHFTGPHLWNPALVQRVQGAGIPVMHTIHDLEPHAGQRFGTLLRPWNRAVIRRADMILVHGEVYRRRLVEKGVRAERVAATPLLHLFLSYEAVAQLDGRAPEVSYEPILLFFGRLEAYKGVEHLLAAFAEINEGGDGPCRLVLAGRGDIERLWSGELPPNVELLNQHIGDAQALELFRRCSLVLLPYVGATQSALPGAAYYFSKAALVSRSGALPEYVCEGETGFVVAPGDPARLARALAAALSAPGQLRDMGRAGRRWYERRRAQEWQELEGLYGALASRAPRERASQRRAQE